VAFACVILGDVTLSGLVADAQAVKPPATPDPKAAQSAAGAEPKVLADGVGAKYIRVENMHRVRFIEIFLAGREAKTGNVVAACLPSSMATG
jgi:hypothetical protein